MKKYIVTIILLGLVSTLFFACNKQEEEELFNVRISVNDFKISTESFKSGAKDIASADTSNAIKYLTVAVYDGQNVEIANITHSKHDSSNFYAPSNFGSFHFLLPEGNYTVVAVGYWSERYQHNLVVTSPDNAMFNGNVYNCFGAAQEISISRTGSNSISLTLSRMIAALNLRSTDTQPSGFDSIRLDINKGSSRFSPTTGLALDNDGLSRTYPQTDNTGNSVRIVLYTFLQANREMADLTYTLYGQSGTPLIARTIPNIPLKRNRKTIVTGRIFDSISSQFYIDNTWEPDTTFNF